MNLVLIVGKQKDWILMTFFGKLFISACNDNLYHQDFDI
jgi:hypothetical protein